METTVLIPHGKLHIPCKISEPDYGQIRRVVLGVHGFGGSTQDDIQVGIAEEMTLFHSVSVRFDFPAHGEYPEDSEDFSLARCMDTLLTVAAYARHRYEDVEDLCIFASGFGAYVTLLCLQDLLEMPGKVKLVVQTPSVRMHETLLSMLRMSRETLWAMHKAVIRAPRPFEVTYRFFEELQEHIDYEACKHMSSHN